MLTESSGGVDSPVVTVSPVITVDWGVDCLSSFGTGVFSSASSSLVTVKLTSEELESFEAVSRGENATPSAPMTGRDEVLGLPPAAVVEGVEVEGASVAEILRDCEELRLGSDVDA